MLVFIRRISARRGVYIFADLPGTLRFLEGKLQPARAQVAACISLLHTSWPSSLACMLTNAEGLPGHSYDDMSPAVELERDRLMHAWPGLHA